MADILIKGMEMPKNNESIKVFIITSEEVFLMVDEGTGKKLDAVEVPPHGELISRQDVIEVLKDACEEGCNDNYTNSVRRAIFDEILEVVEDKEILPTVLEAST